MFNEESTVEQIIVDTLCDGAVSNIVTEELGCFWWEFM